MKKTNLAIAFLICTSVNATSQIINNNQENTTYKKKTIGINGGSIGLGNGILNLSTNIRYAYLYSNSLEIGANAGFTHFGKYYNSVSFGPDIRYYFNKNRVTPFVQFKSILSISKRSYLTNSTYSSYPDLYNNVILGLNNSAGLGLRLKTKNEKFSIDVVYNIGSLLFNNKLLPINNTLFRLNYHF